MPDDQNAAPPSPPTIIFDPAYSGGLLRMNPEIWPLPTVFDIDGLEERPQDVPIIRDHDQNQKLGQTFRIDYDGGRIVASGRLINYGIDPDAGKIVELAKRGAKLEASVATGIIAPDDIESVPAGATAAANGRTFEGPIEIVRKWRLKEISVVTLGADDAGTRVVVGTAAGNFVAARAPKNARPQESEQRKEPEKMVKRSIFDRFKSKTAARVAKAAAEGGTLPASEIVSALEAVAEEVVESAQANGETDPNKTGAAENDDATADPAFAAFAEELGIDVETASPEVLEVAKAAFAKYAAANGETDPNKTGAAEGETDPNKTGAAEAPPDDGKSGAASGGYGVGPANPWTRTKYPADALGSKTQTLPGWPASSGRPTAARVAEAALMTSGGASPDVLKNVGFNEAEINEAISAPNRNLTIRDMLYRVGAAKAGYQITANDLGETLRLAWRDRDRTPRVGQAAGALSTVDIPNVLSNAMHKSLLRGINAIPDPTDQISRVVNAKDFREQNFVNLFLEGEFAEMKKNGDMESLQASDENYQARAKTRAFDIRFTFEDIANDDMGALLDAPRLMGRKAGIRKQKIFWKTLADNLTEIAVPPGNPKLTLAGLDKCCAEFEKIVDPSGDLVWSTPRFLIVPTALKATAYNLVNATQVLATGGGSDVSIVPNVNRYAAMFDVISTPFLGSGTENATNWGDAKYMLLADPADVPLMMISYYQNQTQPTVQTVYGELPVDGLRIACWWSFGVSVAEKRGAVVSSGAAT